MSVARTILPVTVNLGLATVTGGPVADDNPGLITSLFGQRPPFQDPDTGIWTSDFHSGLDIAYAPWTAGVVPLLALFAGTVEAKSYNPNSAGHAIRIQSDDGQPTYFEYFHMSEASPFNVGDKVCAGQQIGLIGSTGLSTGPHLHLGIIANWVYIDPLPFLWGCRDVGELIPGTGYFDACGGYHDELGHYSA